MRASNLYGAQVLEIGRYGTGFFLNFDLCDRTAPQSPVATAPRTSGGLTAGLSVHFRLGPIDQPTRLRYAQAPSQNLGGLERFDLWRLFSKVQLTFPGEPDRGRFESFST